MFSCEFCELSKNPFFTEHLRATAFAFSGSHPFLWKHLVLQKQPPKWFLEVFLGKGVLKVCSKFSSEHPRQSVISINLLLVEAILFHGSHSL